MPTEKPRFSLSIPQELLNRIDQYRFDNHIKNLHPHDLRHSYAVAALRSGIDVKTVQHNPGHKSATMTLDTYAAYTSDACKTGAKKLSNYFSGLKN